MCHCCHVWFADMLETCTLQVRCLLSVALSLSLSVACFTFQPPPSSPLPPAVFERRHKYGMAVHMSRHPDVNKYIVDTLASCRKLLSKVSMRQYRLVYGNVHITSCLRAVQGLLERLYFVVTGPDGRAVERFCFDITVTLDALTAATYGELTVRRPPAALCVPGRVFDRPAHHLCVSSSLCRNSSRPLFARCRRWT